MFRAVPPRAAVPWLVAALASAACSADTPPEPSPVVPPELQSPAAAGDHRHELDVDWKRFSESELHRSATVVIRGRVIEQKSGTHRTYPFDPSRGRELSADEAGDEYAELPLTTSVLRIEEMLHADVGAAARDASAIAVGATLEVVQLGGRYADGCWVEPNEQPILIKHAEAVVYLKPAPMVPRETLDRTGVYSVIGGQQGHVPLEAGSAKPHADTVFARYDGWTISALSPELVRRGRAERGR